MADNDIYNSKQQYETIVKKVNDGDYFKRTKKLIYNIRNKKNCKYFKELIKEFAYTDISYIRRIQFLKALRKTTAHTNKDLKDLTREDVKRIITKLNSVHKTLNTRKDYVNYNKAIWKIILPEKDVKGRPDDTITPYAWRVKVHADKSTQKDRNDKITTSEYQKIMTALNKDSRMQLYFSLLYENLARPQELCYLNIEDVMIHDGYARIRIKEHGKEGTKTLQVIEGYYYLTKWLNEHPLKDKKKVPLFVTISNNTTNGRISPQIANYIIRKVLKKLKIDKPITAYSFKRNGVTHKYINGDTAQSIQKTAGWTSTDQLRTYDLSEAEDFFKQELIKKGIIKAKDKQKKKIVSFKQCYACNTINPLSNEFCSQCKRPLDRNKILEEEKKKEDTITELNQRMEKLEKALKIISLYEKRKTS